MMMSVLILSLAPICEVATGASVHRMMEQAASQVSSKKNTAIIWQCLDEKELLSITDKLIFI